MTAWQGPPTGAKSVNSAYGSAILIFMRSFIRALTPSVVLKIYRKLRAKRKKFIRANLKIIKNYAINFKVIDFEIIDTSYRYDLKWGWWSRVYEYELVLQKLRDLKCSPKSQVHNTCWGFQGCHILFKAELESLYPNVVNSDLLPSTITNTVVHDLKNPCPDEWVGKFDFVINVSTVEEINYPHTQILENLLRMVKVGGFLIATFDLPGLQLEMIEKLFGRTIKLANNPVTGGSSADKMDQFDYLKVGYFVIQRL